MYGLPRRAVWNLRCTSPHESLPERLGCDWNVLITMYSAPTDNQSYSASAVDIDSPPGSADWPVFVIGCYRSGTTLLRYLLDAHDHLTCPPESKFIGALDSFLQYPQVREAFGYLGFSEQDVCARLGAFAGNLFSDYAARQGKRRWVDKTPNYYRCIPLIDRMFGGKVLYIVIVRHPLDCISSLRKWFHADRQNTEDDPVVVEAFRTCGSSRAAWGKFWRSVYETIETSARQNPHRFHLLRYEDLVTNPNETFARALNFIGEPFSEVVIQRAFEVEHQRGFQDSHIRRTRSVHSNSVDRWKEWPPWEIQTTWKAVEPVAKKYGYEMTPDAWRGWGPYRSFLTGEFHRQKQRVQRKIARLVAR